MSSINSADRSNTDEVRRARETFNSRESESAKKHAQELKRLSESHEADMEKLREEHERETGTLKEKTKGALTSKDMRYQKEISDLRDMHQQQLKRAAMDSENKLDRYEESSKADLEKSEAISEQQRNALKSSLQGQLSERDRELQDNMTRSRESLQTESSGIKEKLNSAHEKETKELAKSRDQKVSAMQTQYEGLRRAKDEQIKSMDRDFKSQAARRQTEFAATVDGERADAHAQEESQREGFNQALGRNRDHYRKALDEANDRINGDRDELHRTADDRINGRLRSLEDSSRRAQGDARRDGMKAEASKQRELDDVRGEYGRTIDAYERARKDQLAASNEQNQREISRASRQADEKLHGVTNFYLEKSARDEARNEERFDQQALDGEKTRQHSETRSSSRFERLRAGNEMEQARAREYFDNAGKSMRENFETTLREMRQRNQDERQKMMVQFNQQAADLDKKSQERLAETQIKYESEIGEINDRHQKELKDMAALADRRLKDTQRKDQQDIQTQVSQLQYRIAKNEETHKKDLEEMQRKHEEALANLTKNRQS